MSDTAPTPETDSVVTPCVVFHGQQSVDSMVLADFARKLERERDALRLEAKYHDEADALRKLRERERDEARKRVMVLARRWRHADKMGDEARAEVARLLSMSVCELAAHNDNVRDYVSHWEGRALAAEAEVARIKAENTLFRDATMFCEGCDEPTMKEHRELKAEVARLKDWQSIKVTKNGETHPLGTLIGMLEAEVARLRAAPVRIYNSGYHAGHYDTAASKGRRSEA